MAKQIVKCRCHDIEVGSTQIQEGVDLFIVWCTEDQTLWAFWGELDAVPSVGLNYLLEQHVSEAPLGIFTENLPSESDIQDRTEHPTEVFNSFFYITVLDDGNI